MEMTVLGRSDSMCKKGEHGLLKELKVALCMTGNHIAKRCWEGKRAPRDKGMATGKEPFTPVKENGLYLEDNGSQ